jgi:hypothetical protein
MACEAAENHSDFCISSLLEEIQNKKRAFAATGLTFC